MKKSWEMPEIETVTISATEYHPAGGNTEDGAFTNKAGVVLFRTYGPSTGNTGRPEVSVQ